MATLQNTHGMVPLHISGNTSDQQSRMLKDFLGEATEEAFRATIKQLDKQSAQAVLDMAATLKPAVAGAMVEIIQRYTASGKYKDEEVKSDRVYPPTYRVRPVETQVRELRKLFPSLGGCMEQLGLMPIPEGAEDWFAIPRWQALAPTYNEAVEMVLAALASRRRFANRVAGRLGPTYLRQGERATLAEEILANQQPGSDILVIAAQAGLLHRGCSARRTRVALAGNEFGLGVFAMSCLLLTHPERLSSDDTLMIDCGGDQYSLRGDYTFDRVPLFDFDSPGIEFSIFYEDRARNLWGTPTGFLYKPA
jgi:hypothetical protein